MTAVIEDRFSDMMRNQVKWLDALAAQQWGPAFANDPIAEVLFAESVYQFLCERMAEVGFILPEVPAAFDDPLGFVAKAAAALRKFHPFLAPTAHSPFEPIPAEMTVQ